MKFFNKLTLLLALALAPVFAQAQLLPTETGTELAALAQSLQPKGDCDRDNVLNNVDDDIDGDGIKNDTDETVECKKDKGGWILLGTFGALTLLMYDDSPETISP